MGALLLTGAGCSPDHDPRERDAIGSARVRLVTARVNAGEITRVTITASNGTSVDLERDATGEGFSGSLILPVGPTELVGQAFIDEALVAESQPTPIVVEEGAVTSVSLRLLDLTGDDEIPYGPIILALVHPEAAVAGQPAQLSVSAVDPDGDDVSVAWSSDCADASFSDPTAAETQWVKSSEGTCNVTVEVRSSGLSASSTFNIVVFAGGNTGAVEVGGVIVSRPQIFLGLDYGAFCDVFPGSANGSCPTPIESTRSASLFVNVLWDNAQPGVIEVFDDCGGATEILFADPFFAEGQWTPPSAAGVCMVGARATSPDGVSAEIRVALAVVAPQTPPPPPPPAYLRASLRPLVQLTPQAEFGRFEVLGETMTTSDFQTPATFISMEQKVNEIGAQLGFERGQEPLDLFIDAENRARAALIPFRGKPSDVASALVDGVRKAYVPLGGTFTSPGNEVAAVNLDNGAVQRIRVGVRPQQVAVHEASGLVFVCNQLSNYVSIIDSRFDDLLEQGGAPVEIATEFHCSDLALVERDPAFGEPDELYLYVANAWRGSVLKYSIDIVRDINDDPVDVDVTPVPGQPPHVPLAEIVGAGKSPARLHVSEALNQIYVASRRGGEVAVVNVVTDEVERLVALNAPAADVVQIADAVFVPTTTPFRGLLDGNGLIPDSVDSEPVLVVGADGQEHAAHPGSLFDQTDSYGFEDVRSGIFRLRANLTGTTDYFTDDNAADDFFTNDRKVLAGAVPQAMVRTAAGDRVYVALSGSDLIQELQVVGGTVGLQPSGLVFQTSEVPVALAVDESAGVLLSVGRSSDMLEIFDVTNGQLLAQIDLGYALPRFPATTIEAGEYLFQTAKWSNDGRKACTSCHFDEGITDGLSFSTGTTAPTAYHKVKPVWNLMESDAYGWNGSYMNGSQASLAIDAQSRTNCELIAYGLIEGPGADPSIRIGDAFNNYTSGSDDASCRPNTFVIDEAGLPTSLDGDVNGDGVLSFQDIGDIIASQRQIAAATMPLAVQDQLLRAGLDLDRADMVRAIDFFTVSELRLPPSPLADPFLVSALYPELQARLASGEDVFRNLANCDNCHDPDNARHPFADGRSHGAGASFIRDFVVTYEQDPRLLQFLPGGVPEQMLFTAQSDFTPQEVNFHHNPLDYLVPFCFDADLCLEMENPLAVIGSTAETERLLRIIVMYLLDPDGGFLPGQVVGQARVDTPSLRGTWFQSSLLRHGHALSVREAVLAPGHAALQDGELGLAVDRRGSFNVHGETLDLSPAQVEDLVLYVEAIE